MNRFGLIGRNISYSLSKKIHEGIARMNGYRLVYDIYDCETELDVIARLNQLRQGSIKGLNVTIPYKESVMRYCDRLTDTAKEIGAVNTLYMIDNELVGDNTDYYGFIKLLNLYHVNPKGKVSYILGSGGAAKAVNYALKSLGAKPVVVSRDKERIKDQFQLVANYEVLDIVPQIDIMVNTTPIGTSPRGDQMPVSKSIAQKTVVAIDLIYNPKETALMKTASFGIGGATMLVGQAMKAQAIWLDRVIDESKEAFDALVEEMHS